MNSIAFINEKSNLRKINRNSESNTDAAVFCPVDGLYLSDPFDTMYLISITQSLHHNYIKILQEDQGTSHLECSFHIEYLLNLQIPTTLFEINQLAHRKISHS